jgi:hypothetical protein
VKLAAHQPNLMPWNPFFEKCAQADIFVILGQVQFEKNNYQNRFRVGGDWQTLSVRSGLDPIIEKQYVDSVRDWSRIKARLPQYSELLSSFDRFVSESLWQTNTQIITDIIHRLNISTRIEFDFPTKAKGTARLVEICENYGATTYLSGPSGRKYLEPVMFEKAGINLEYFENDGASTHSGSILERLNECR